MTPYRQVLADPGTAVTARSTVALTMPMEFDLSAPRSAPVSPRSPAQYKAVAEQVKSFTKTPARFRTKPAGAPRTPLESSKLSVTHSKSMSFLTDQRSLGRTSYVKSSEEIEIEKMASIPKFKARPVSRKVLESVGDLGVPRVQRPPPTKPREFMLSGSRTARSYRPDDDDDDKHSTSSEPAYTFKARPFNKTIVERPTGLAQVTPKKTTRPRSPNFATSLRARPAAPAEPVEEDFSMFKARAIPASIYSPRMVKPTEERPITSPKPFKLAGEVRHTIASEVRARQLQEEERREAEARQFKARPMPVGDAWKPSCEAHVTDLAPFNLNTEQRGSVDVSRREQMLAEAAALAKREREFHARPAKVVSTAPFVPRKSTKPLTEITGFNIFTDERSEKRKALEAENAKRRAQRELQVLEDAQRKARQEAADLAELRRQMSFKARPASVLNKQPFTLQKSTPRTTKPESPHLATKGRGAIRCS